MNKIKAVVVILLVVLTTSCSGSDTYLGKWKAIDAKGNKCEINFSENEFTVTDNSGKTTVHNYMQHGVMHQGSTNKTIDTYEIRLNNGMKYQLYFPNADDASGVIRLDYGENVYSISRTEYLTAEAIYKKE